MLTTALDTCLDDAAALSTLRCETFESSVGVLIVEGHPGNARRAWLKGRLSEAAFSGATTFAADCDFDRKGPWAGVDDLLRALLPDIQTQRPDLIERHSFELVYVFPELRRTLEVRNPNLTDLAEGAERTRNYPADRAYRNAHGLIDLLDSWKREACREALWVVACDSFDRSGTMCRFFFQELARRRGQTLNLKFIATGESGTAACIQAGFDRTVNTQILHLDFAADAPVEVDHLVAAKEAEEIEEQIGNDLLETRIRLSDLIRLWRAAKRPEKLLHYKFFALENYNTAGLYSDAIRYSDGLLELAGDHLPEDDYYKWSIVLKLFMCHLGLNDFESALAIAEREGQKLADRHADLQADLCYLLAMLWSRFAKPRDLAKGEEYLERGLAAIEQAGLSEEKRHFKTVFNRNGLAMIRNFQARREDAVELCREGLERLNQKLTDDEHRLHRSVLSYNMAQVSAALGRNEEALEYFSVAMEMDPNYSEYYNDRGNVLLKMGRLEEAKTDYLMAIELSPPYFEVFANLGQCYRRMSEMESAILAYSRALDLEPRNVLALLGRAKAHEELAHVDAAIGDYTDALSLDRSTWEAFASRAVLYYESGDLFASLHDFNAAIALKKDVSDLYGNRATVLAQMGRKGEAIDDLQAALRLGPNHEDELAIMDKLEELSQVAVKSEFVRLTN